MDPWLVAAAAGAGCLAKYWQSLSRDREGLSGFASRSKSAAKTGSSSLIGQILDKTSFQMERKPQQQILTEIENENLSDGRFVETTQLYKHLSEEVASTSAVEDEQQEFVRKHQQYKLLSSSILQPVVPKYENNQEYGDGIRWDGHVGGIIGETLEQSTWEMDTLSGFGKGRSSLRSRCNHLQSLKPLNSLEICLMAQLYKEHAEMEYVLGPNPSSKPTLRPFYVSDGSQIISKASLDSYCVQIGDERDKLQKEVHPEANEKAVEIPHISKIWSAKGSKKQHLGKGKDLIGKLSSSEQLINEMQFQTQGSLSGVVLFCLGISIGVVSNILANKMEMEKLKELLKQTENLVQDLQEELEMKDSLTLKELVNENDSSLDAHDSSIKNRSTIAHSTQSNSNEAVKYSGGESEAQKTDEKLESMYKIEAELEAELERLELNMKESSLHGLLDVVKLDPDLTAAGMASRRAGSRPVSDCDSSRASTSNWEKHGISPHELSLRLHEVIQSRLEQRILDLEAALGESQQRVQLLELERASYWRDFLRSQSPSSTPGSPMARPLLMNLSGEALDAYCEACEELGKINGFENEDCLFEIDRNNRETVLPSGGQGGGHSFVQNMLDKQKGMANGSVLCALDMEEDTSAQDMQMTQQSNEHLNRNMTENEDNNDADDDGNMWLLIKQIVEKTRRGSPAVLHAQRAMISLDKESTLKEAK